MQCRVSVLRCIIEQRFLYNFVFGTQAAQLCRFVDSEALMLQPGVYHDLQF